MERLRSELSRVAGIAVALVAAAWSPPAPAGLVETSLGFAMSRMAFAEESFVFNRRWGASVAYHLSGYSGVELTIQDAFSHAHIEGFSDTTSRDLMIIVHWVQSILHKDGWIQPYFKVGLGKAQRRMGSSHAGWTSSETPARSLLATSVGGGARVFVSENFGFRLELNTYLLGQDLGGMGDNLALQWSVSLYL